METDLPSDWFAMAVLGCRSLVLVIQLIQPSTKKDKNCGQNFIKNGCNYDKNMIKIWWNNDSLIHSETKCSTLIN